MDGMSVLITNGYFYRLDPKQWETAQPYPPLGTLLATAVARQLTDAVSFFDNSLTPGPAEIVGHIRRTHPDILLIWDDGFNYLTKMCLTNMRQAVLEITQEASKDGCKVIICSSDASDHFAFYLKAGALAVIRGEGEETLRELLPLVLDHKPFHHLPGISFTREGETISNVPREVLRDLDALPIPAWDLLDIQPYREIWLSKSGYFSLNIATTRGCPYKCNWCAKPIYGNRYHARSPRVVADEIELLLDKFHPDHFWMCDDIFGLKPGWIQEFAREIQSRRLSFRYKIQSRVDLLLRDDTIAALAASGAESVWVGAESGSQAILDAMDKGTSVGQIALATERLQHAGLRVGFFIQFGYPGETMQDIDQTIRMILRLMPDELGVSVSYPLPGTPFYEKVKAELKSKQNWTDSDDLTLMFSNTYKPAFYKILHRYLHARFRVRRGWLLLTGRLKHRRRAEIPRWTLSMIYHWPLTWFHHWQLKTAR